MRTPSPLPLQPGMDTGFDPPGQPAPPRPVTGGGARVRIAAPAERWGGFGTRVSGSRDRPAMSLAHFPTWLGKGRVSPSHHHEASLQAQPSAVPHADTAPGHGLAGRPDLHHSAIRVMSTGQARWMTSLGSGPGARPNLHWPTHRLPNTSGALCQPHVVTVLGSRDVAVFWVGDDSERERGQAPGDSSPPNQHRPSPALNSGTTHQGNPLLTAPHHSAPLQPGRSGFLVLISDDP